MKKNIDLEIFADHIIESMGGKENISFFTHCLTRLRFNVKDRSAVDEQSIEREGNVVGSKWAGGQFQVIVGQNVIEAYDCITKKIDSNTSNVNTVSETKIRFSWAAIFDAFAGCFTPLLPLLIAAGMIRTVVLIAIQLGILSTTNGTYLTLNTISDAGFYFLPIFVGATSARKFGANMGLGMLVGAMLLHPQFIESLSKGELSFFNLPIYTASYSYTVFPTIMAVFIMSKVEKIISTRSPLLLRSVLEPVGTILIMIPLTLLLIGPLGTFLGNYVTEGIIFLYQTFSFFGVAILAAVWPLLVLTGMHSAIVPYQMQSLAVLGYEPIALTAIIISNFNQGAASIAVAVKTKNFNLKSSAISCAATAVVAGITEPAMFGINLRYKKPMIAAMSGSFIAAGIAGFFKVYAFSYVGSAGIFGLPVFLSSNVMNLICMLMSCLLGMLITFVLTLFLYRNSTVE